jgi:hypothetical protein
LALPILQRLVTISYMFVFIFLLQLLNDDDVPLVLPEINYLMSYVLCLTYSYIYCVIFFFIRYHSAIAWLLFLIFNHFLCVFIYGRFVCMFSGQ